MSEIRYPMFENNERAPEVYLNVVTPAKMYFHEMANLKSDMSVGNVHVSVFWGYICIGVYFSVVHF